MSELKVYQALVKAIREVPGMIPFSVPGKVFQAPAGGLPYANLTHHPNVPEAYTLGGNGEDMQMGFTQLLLKYPPDGEIFNPTRLGDVLRSTFKAGHRVHYEDQEVVIVRSGLGQFSQLENRLVNPFTIYWYSLIRR